MSGSKQVAHASLVQGAEERSEVRLALWHAPSAILARLILHRYLRSGWLWGELVVVLALFGVFWHYAGDEAYFSGVATLGLGALAIRGGTIITRRALGARACLPLARLTGRAAYPRALALASGALRLAWLTLLLLLALAGRKILNPSAGGMLVGTLGLLANLLVVVAATLALSPPIATRLQRIVFLTWLVAALSSYHYGGPLANLLAVAQLPLLPLVGCFTLGMNGTLGWPGVGALAADGVYVAGLVWLAARWLACRDLAL